MKYLHYSKMAEKISIQTIMLLTLICAQAYASKRGR